NHDSLAVDGTATLDGALRLSLSPTFFTTPIVFSNVVTAATFNGTRFASVSLSVPFSPFLVFSTEYTPQTAGLERVNVTLSRIPLAEPPGTINQHAVGGGLDAGCAGTLTSAGATLCGAVLFSPSVSVLDTLSGEIASGVQNPSFLIGEQFLDA